MINGRIRVRGLLAAALLLLVGVAQADAQSKQTILLGAGLALPAGIFNSYADNGYDLTGGIEHRFGNHPTALRVDVSYAVNTDTSGIGYKEHTRLINVMADLVYHFEGSRPHLYVLAGVGQFWRRFSSEDPFDPPINDARLGLQLGEGVAFRIKGALLFAEGRFVTGVGPQPLRFFPVIVGVRFGRKY